MLILRHNCFDKFKIFPTKSEKSAESNVVVFLPARELISNANRTKRKRGEHRLLNLHCEFAGSSFAMVA